MFISALLLSAALLAADDPSPASAKALEALQALHLKEASTWTMFIDDERKTKAELREKPIYVWTNPTRSGGQHGAVFVWTHRGRPVVVGSTFSHPEKGQRMVCHEFHSLATGPLLPDHGKAAEGWSPKASIEFVRFPKAPEPDASPAKRLLQMRMLSRDFTAYSIDVDKERWELRLLPQPLYRYEKPQDDVLDGALFGFVTSAGTDPEVVLAIEARKTGGSVAWHYRAIRFSDSDLHVQHAGKQAWSSVRDDKNTLHYNPDHTYRLIRDHHLDELPELAADAK